MNIKTEDKCKQNFEDLKYRKMQARYIVYSIENEQIVVLNVNVRLLKELVIRKKTGTPLLKSFPRMSTDSVCLTLSSKMRTK